MMKKALFIFVLMIAAMAVNAQTKSQSELTLFKKFQPAKAKLTVPSRVKGLPLWYRIILTIEQKQALKRGDRVALVGAAQVPTSVPKKSVRTAIKASELPKPVADDIATLLATDFVEGCTIHNATKVVTGEEVTYEVVIVKGDNLDTYEVLVYGIE